MFAPLFEKSPQVFPQWPRKALASGKVSEGGRVENHGPAGIIVPDFSAKNNLAPGTGRE